VTGEPTLPPAGVRTNAPVDPEATRIVLLRHGEATCNIDGVVGGVLGCRGLSELGIAQAHRLATRLAETGELAGVTALYSSILPRAIETARIIAPALEKWADGITLEIQEDCDLCELHPGEADGLSWADYTERYGELDWGRDPTLLFSPGGESWSGFVARASGALDALALRHRGELVVVACHAGFIEASMITFLPIDLQGHRALLRVEHCAMTEWERGEAGWLLRRYNDATR
jgi:probable phosphoglycerate mutase